MTSSVRNHVMFLSGAEGFTTEEDQEMLARIEKQIKKRFVIGSQVSEHAIIQDFLKQVRSCLRTPLVNCSILRRQQVVFLFRNTQSAPSAKWCT